MHIRELIIEATIEEFNEKGLKFTMDQLAKRLGISKKTLYQEFYDKESLFLESVDVCFKEIKKSERAVLEDNTLDVIEKIKRIIIVLPDRYKTLDFRQLYELEEKYPAIYKKIESKLETDWEPTLQLLEKGIEEGKIRPINLTILKIMLSATIETFIRTNILIKSNIAYVEALEEMIELVMSGICMDKVIEA